MGDSNVTFNKCISENRRYAECFNLAVGKRVISAEGLYDINTVVAERRLNGQGSYEKRRDCIKAYETQAVCAIAAITNTEVLDDVIKKAENAEGGIDMCKAFEEMIAEGKAEGKAEERKLSIRNLILTLREIGVEEAVIREKVMLRYQLSPEEAKTELRSV